MPLLAGYPMLELLVDGLHGSTSHGVIRCTAAFACRNRYTVMLSTIIQPQQLSSCLVPATNPSLDSGTARGDAFVPFGANDQHPPQIARSIFPLLRAAPSHPRLAPSPRTLASHPRRPLAPSHPSHPLGCTCSSSMPRNRFTALGLEVWRHGGVEVWGCSAGCPPC